MFKKNKVKTFEIKVNDGCICHLVLERFEGLYKVTTLFSNIVWHELCFDSYTRAVKYCRKMEDLMGEW